MKTLIAVAVIGMLACAGAGLVGTGGQPVRSKELAKATETPKAREWMFAPNPILDKQVKKPVARTIGTIPAGDPSMQTATYMDGVGWIHHDQRSSGMHSIGGGGN